MDTKSLFWQFLNVDVYKINSVYTFQPDEMFSFANVSLSVCELKLHLQSEYDRRSAWFVLQHSKLQL